MAKKPTVGSEGIASSVVATEAASGRSPPSATSRARGRTVATPQTVARTPERTPTLEQERDRLQAALAAALIRIQALEAAQAQVSNRIGWMIDALQTLRDEGR